MFVKLLISLIANILVVCYLANPEYDILGLIEGIAFFFAFGYGVPVILSIVLAIVILISPGIGIFSLWSFLEKNKYKLK